MPGDGVAQVEYRQESFGRSNDGLDRSFAAGDRLGVVAFT
jgi:hypothetical protein